MERLASMLQAQFEQLTRQYEQRLSTIDAYAQLPVQERLGIAHTVFGFVIESLKKQDDRGLAEFMRARVQVFLERSGQSGYIAIESFLRVLSELEDMLLPLVDTVEDAKFLWRSLSRARTMVSDLVSGAFGESQQILRLIMDNMPQTAFWKDRDLTYLGCNQAFAEKRGLSAPDDVIGKTDFDLSPRAQAELYRADDFQVLESGIPRLNYEEPMITPQGERRWLRTSKVPLRDAEQNVIAVLGMYEDITESKQAEIELQRLASAIDAVHEIVFITDRNGDVQFVNPAFERVTGYTPEEVLGQNPRVLKSGRQGETFYAHMWQTIASGNVWEGEVTNRRKDGTLYEAQVTISPVRGVDGEVDRFVAIQRDVTEQKRLEQEMQQELAERTRAEQALRDEKRLMDALMNNITDSIFFKDREARLTRVSQNMATSLGLDDPVQIVGKTDVDLFGEQYGQQTLVDDLRVMERGEAAIGVIESRDTGDGGKIWTSTTKVPLRDEDGKIVGLAGIARDISEMMRAENALRESQQMLRSIVDTIPEMIFWKDRNSVFMGCNERFALAAGMESPEEIIGKTDYNMAWTKEQSDAFIADDREVIESATPNLHIIETQRQADGRQTWQETNKVPLFDAEGNVSGILGTAVDITERMAAQEALRASQQMLQSVIDSIPQTVFWKDRNLVFLGCNEAFARSARLDSAQDIVGKTDFDLWWADNAEQFRAEDKKVIETGIPILHQEQLRAGSDGWQSWIEVNKVPLRDEKGDVWAVLNTQEDITERKLAEDALRTSQQRLAFHVQQTPLAVIEWNAAFEVTDWNPAAERIFGYSRAEAVGRHAAGLIVPVSVKESVDQVWQDLLTQRGGSRSTNENVTKDGRTIICEWYNTPLIDQDNNVLGVASLVQDVTEQSQAYERRAQQVRASTEVAQEIAAAPALELLLERVVTLVKDRFGYYHVQLYRYEPDRNEMVLLVGYGEPGARMVASGHALQMGTGIVGAAAASGQSILVNNIAQEPDWEPNPNLPETKDELAVPIKWRDDVVGILDVQSDQVGALTAEDQLVLEGLCGQIAIAIQNTQALDEARTFRQLVEGTGQGIGMGTLDGNTFYGNPALIRMLDEPGLEAFIGKPFLTYYGQVEQQRLENEIIPAVMNQGRWQGEVTMLSRKGQMIPTIHNLFLLRDEAGQPRYLVNMVTDITASKRTQAEMEERLQELNNLYRTMSEEGWQAFRETADLPGGYLFDGVEARGADDLWLPEMGLAVVERKLVSPAADQGATVAPLAVAGGEVVGALGVYDDPDHPLSAQEETLIQAVADEVAQALESARLSQETQAALRQTQTLYDINRDLSTAQNEDELLQILARPAINVGAANVSLVYLDLDRAGQPEWAEVVAVWTQSGIPSAPVGTRFYLPEMPFTRLWVSDPNNAVFVTDISTDERVDQSTRRVLAQSGSRAMVNVPLTRAGHWIGLITFNWAVTHRFDQQEIALYNAFAGMVAPIVESRQLLQQTQARAQREQQLREISERLRSQPDVDGVLRALARELGQALGRRTFVGMSRATAARPRVQEDV
ncbi:MAG: PAS domain S-box protein [Anaerolineae bacterium]|nr:PAS domain S-box protein [Anaerolineae bacterium]